MTPPTKITLLNRVADVALLHKAWRVVRRSALSSQSLKIVSQAKAFDQESITNLRRIESSLREGSFVFEGVYARLLPREGKDPRPLAVAKMAERIVQRAIHDVLLMNPHVKGLIKPEGAKNSFGGIRKESTRNAIEELCKCIQGGYNYYISSDIKDFFRGINRADVHSKIFKYLEDGSIDSLIERSVECEIINASSPAVKRYIDLFPKGEVGVVQGCCLSPLYGNVYLSDFDTAMNSYNGVRCLRYIDDFVVIGSRERQVRKVFERAVELLRGKNLNAYTLTEENTKASFGDIRHAAVNFLGCSISKGQVRPQLKAKDGLCSKIDSCIKASLKEMRSTNGKSLTNLSYVNTITKINNMLKGWGGAFSFCNDRAYFERLDGVIMDKIKMYNHDFKMIVGKIESARGKNRLMGVQMLADCAESNPVYGQAESNH